MPKREAPPKRLYEAGDWWIERRSGTGNLQRCTYNSVTRRVDRFTLGTGDLGIAKPALHRFLAEQYDPPPPPPAEVTVAHVLRHYFLKVRQGGASETQAKAELRFWTDWWGDSKVAEMTPQRIEQFTAWLKEQKTSPGNGVRHHQAEPLSSGYVSKILSSGRAALKLADKENTIIKAPFIPDVETADDKRNKDPKGRPVSVREAAKLFDAAATGPEHMWRFLISLCCSVSRPDAILDLHATMCRRDEGYCNLLPPGRKQTKKRRGIIPICKTWDAWLAQWPAVGPIVGFTRETKKNPDKVYPVKSIDKAWALMRARAFPPTAEQLAELPPLETFAGHARWAESRRRAMICHPEADGITPYSFRHTLPRYMRRQRVPADQISIYLSHIVPTEHGTTMIYSPHDPDYCQEAVDAVDAWCHEVSTLQAAGKRICKGRFVPALIAGTEAPQ
jgi:integrase